MSRTNMPRVAEELTDNLQSIQLSPQWNGLRETKIAILLDLHSMSKSEFQGFVQVSSENAVTSTRA